MKAFSEMKDILAYNREGPENQTKRLLPITIEEEIHECCVPPIKFLQA